MRSLKSNLLRVAIVGASTLKGREIQSVLRDRKFPLKKLVLLDSDEDLGRLSEFEGEPVVSLAISDSSLEFLDVAFFASNAEQAHAHAHLAAKNKFLLVDLSHAFSEDASVPVFLENQPADRAIASTLGLVASPHPAAITVAAILEPLSQAFSIGSMVVSIFEPASERGNSAIEELRQQTISIFSFQKIPKIVFDSQLAFNLLSRLGEDAREPLISSERVIANHLRALLRPGSLLPSIALIQAPVFHSHAFSFFVEMDAAVPIAALEKCLESDVISVSGTDSEPPSPVEMAGNDGIQIGGMRRDSLNPRGVWFWAASDNLRLAAVNAVAAAERYLLQQLMEGKLTRSHD
jgi:aspartate-semialdehyde dehydrogenase